MNVTPFQAFLTPMPAWLVDGGSTFTVDPSPVGGGDYTVTIDLEAGQQLKSCAVELYALPDDGILTIDPSIMATSPPPEVTRAGTVGGFMVPTSPYLSGSIPIPITIPDLPPGSYALTLDCGVSGTFTRGALKFQVEAPLESTTTTAESTTTTADSTTTPSEATTTPQPATTTSVTLPVSGSTTLVPGGELPETGSGAPSALLMLGLAAVVFGFIVVGSTKKRPSSKH